MKQKTEGNGSIKKENTQKDRLTGGKLYPGSEIVSNKLQKNKEYEVKKYDFTRPDKFSRDQIRTISIMHETFARLTTATLSAQLRNLCHMHVASVDQLTYEEFILSASNPSTFAVINMDPLFGSTVLEIDPVITFSIIDRLFGGQGEGRNYSRDLTDIEACIMEGIIVKILGNMREAWCNVLDLNPGLGQIETNPRFTQIVPPTEMVVLVTIDIKIGAVDGMIKLCIPYLTIEPIIYRLSAQYWYSNIKRKKGATNSSVYNLKEKVELIYEGEPVSLKTLAVFNKNSLVKLKNYEQGEAILIQGDIPVLRLKRNDNHKSTSFKIIRDEFQEKNIELLPGFEKSNKQEQIAETINKPIEKLTSSIKTGLKELNNRIMELSNRQSSLTDQLYFSEQIKQSEQLESAEQLSENYYPESRPFNFLHTIDPTHLLNFISVEHPQIIALILSYLKPEFTALLISGLSEELQPDIARRIAVIDRTDPVVLKNVEMVLQKKLINMSPKKMFFSGGIKNIVDILNHTTRKTEKNIIEALDKSDNELSEEIKKRMFVFEDIILLDKLTIKMVMEKCERDDLIHALKIVDDEVKSIIYDTFPENELLNLKRNIKDTGKIRLSDAEAAQLRIVNIIRKLEKEGDIIVARPDELV